MNTVLTNANIYTSDEKNPQAQTIVYNDDEILYVGSGLKSDWEKYAGDDADIHDLNGQTVIPGFIDSHVHPGMVSQSSWHIRLPWTEDVNELLSFVKKYAREHPPSEIPFLYFEYYPTMIFDEKGPTKELLDTAVSDRPCLLQDFGEHLHWVNSKMLELMEINKDTEDPMPGLVMFVRDEKGEPTGWVKEMAWLKFADRMYEKIGWIPPVEMTPELMEDFFEFMADHGITAIAEGILEGEAQFSSQKTLYDQNKIKLYYDGNVRFWTYEDLTEKIAELKRYREKYTSRYMKINTVKLFLDGTNESGNCAVLEPFINDPEGTNVGSIAMELPELKKCLHLINKEGLDLHVHVVADRGFRTMVDAYEQAKSEVEAAGGEWVTQMILAHCELVDPSDMGRPAELGITINWSCHWSGGYFGDEAKSYLGEERWNRMYQFNPMIKSGALVTFSSDVVTKYELNRADPFFGMQVAATKVDPEVPLDPDKYPGSMRPPESAKLSVGNLLKGYTINGAKQLHWEDRMGSLTPGKLANINIISDDPFKVLPEELSGIKFDAVIFEGEVIRGNIG